MGRPKKTESGPLPTRERILIKAMELFAERGYDAVSVRDITRALGLNEASLYNHFASKAELLASIFRRMDEQLINPAFAALPPDMAYGDAPFDLAVFLLSGAKRFYDKAGRETLLTWRILMANQFLHEAARDSVRSHLLDAPRRFFADMLDNLCAAGKIPPDVDCASVGRIIAAVFFDFSFRANLEIAWNNADDEGFMRLASDLTFIAEAIALR